jgi:hypothetical protein
LTFLLPSLLPPFSLPLSSFRSLPSFSVWIRNYSVRILQLGPCIFKLWWKKDQPNAFSK